MFHLAGTLDHSKGADYMMDTNVQGTKNVLEFCRQRKIRKLIHLSTLAVMGTGNALLALTENTPLPDRQIGLYASSKAMAEKVLLNYMGEGLEICIVRPPFVWGNGDNYSLPKLIETINKGIFSWINNGDYLFATCHVENLSEGLYKTYMNGKHKEIYYIQDKELTTIKSFLSDLIATKGLPMPRRNTSAAMVKMVCNLIELPWKILPLKSTPPTHLRETLALMGVPITIASKKAEKELNYFPVADRKTAMEKMLENN